MAIAMDINHIHLDLMHASLLSSLSVMASTYNQIEIERIEIKNYPLSFLLFGLGSFLISLFLIVSSKKIENQLAN
jgi:hydrogenase-4 membrane subunit HyfE